MTLGQRIYLEVCDVPGRRAWLVGVVVSVGRVWVTVAVELADGGTERVRVRRSDVVRDTTNNRRDDRGH